KKRRPESTRVLVDGILDAAARRTGISKQEIRHPEIAVQVRIEELSVGRERRLVPERLIGVQIRAGRDRVFAFDPGHSVIVLLNHIVRLDGAIVRVSNGAISIPKFERRKPLLGGRYGLKSRPIGALDPETGDESRCPRAVLAYSDVLVSREADADLVQQ